MGEENVKVAMKDFMKQAFAKRQDTMPKQ